MKPVPLIAACALLVGITARAYAISRTEGMTTICGAAGMLGWLCHNAASGPSTWYAPICDSDKIQVLGRASESAMQGRFTFDPKATREQREYIEHWRALAAHCMQSPDDRCNERWKPPCSPKCDGAACKPTS